VHNSLKLLALFSVVILATVIAPAAPRAAILYQFLGTPFQTYGQPGTFEWNTNADGTYSFSQSGTVAGLANVDEDYVSSPFSMAPATITIHGTASGMTRNIVAFGTTYLEQPLDGGDVKITLIDPINDLSNVLTLTFTNGALVHLGESEYYLDLTNIAGLDPWNIPSVISGSSDFGPVPNGWSGGLSLYRPTPTSDGGFLANIQDFSLESVPEPSTWLLMVVGFSFAGAGLRLKGSLRTKAVR
jgi:hypothetical protein